MLVTPFGDIEFGNVESVLQWQQAHDTRHRVYRQALATAHGVSLSPVSLVGPLNAEWFGRHALSHVALAPFVPAQNSNARLALEQQWSSKDAFYRWHKYHDDLHTLEDQSILQGQAAVTFSTSTTQIVNAFAANGAAAAGINTVARNALAVVSGALTANTLANVLNLTGRGTVDYFDTYTNDATARTLRVQILVDGVTAFDFTSASITFTGGMFFGGFVNSGAGVTPIPNESPIYFNTSLVINIASSLTETSKFTSSYIYHKY